MAQQYDVLQAAARPYCIRWLLQLKGLFCLQEVKKAAKLLSQSPLGIEPAMLPSPALNVRASSLSQGQSMLQLALWNFCKYA